MFRTYVYVYQSNKIHVTKTGKLGKLRLSSQLKCGFGLTTGWTGGVNSLL